MLCLNGLRRSCSQHESRRAALPSSSISMAALHGHSAPRSPLRVCCSDKKTNGSAVRPLIQLACGSLLASRSIRLLILAVAVTLLCTLAEAAPSVSHCLPPKVPMTDLPVKVLAEYRSEIVAEYEGYFGDLSAYIACLDAERGRALAEGHVATSTYSTLLETVPPSKERQ